jgi:hypothetical protein
VDRQPFFRVRDLVRVSTEHLPPDRQSGKFAARWMGPFPIVGHPSGGIFQVYRVDFGDKCQISCLSATSWIQRTCSMHASYACLPCSRSISNLDC